MSNAKLNAVDNGLFVDIQRFLFSEAALLDRRNYGAWLALISEDVQYRVTAAVVREAGATTVNYAIIDENLAGLKSRMYGCGRACARPTCASTNRNTQTQLCFARLRTVPP